MSRLPRSCRCGGIHYKGQRCSIQPDIYSYEWQETRKRILKRDGYICYLCGGPGAQSVDHIIARANGGTNDDSNLAAAHSLCNSRKGVS